MIKHNKIDGLFLTFLIILLSGCASKQAEIPKNVELEHLDAALICEVTGIQPGTPFWVAVWFELEEGWHINWKNPGDAGLAPTIAWDLPEGFNAGDILWPYPERLSTPPFILFGYENKVLLPVLITPPNNLREGEKVKFAANCDWVVCGDVCIPGSAKLELELPVKNASLTADPKWESEFVSSRNESPLENDLFNLNAVFSENFLTISVIPRTDKLLSIESLVFFPDEQGIIDNAAEQKFSKSDGSFNVEIARDKIVRNQPAVVKGLLMVKSRDWTPPKKGFNVEAALLKKSDS